MRHETEHKSFGEPDETREFPHGKAVSGRFAIRMDDGTDMIAEPGDITSLPSGHGAWMVGDEPVLARELAGAEGPVQ
jgi:hypothetical protein